MEIKQEIIDIPSGGSSDDEPKPDNSSDASGSSESSESDEMESSDSSDSSDSSESDEMTVQKSEVMVWRGPSYGGNRPFDKICVFGNNMRLTKEQCDILNHMVKGSNNVIFSPAIKPYIYKMTPSAVNEEKAKMEFGLEYTKANLRKHIKKPIDILVECATKKKTFLVRMKLAVGSKKAILSGGWATAVKEFKLKRGRIYLFDFVECKRYGLHIMIWPL